MARVLIGLDGSELARRAAERALVLLGPGHEVTLAQVVRPPVPLATAGVEMAPIIGVGAEVAQPSVDQLVADAEADLAAAARALGYATVIPVVSVGDPGNELCQLVDQGSYDLLVVGSHGSGVLKRVLLGSVSHYVLHHAPCPVLVVRSVHDDG